MTTNANKVHNMATIPLDTETMILNLKKLNF